MYGWNVVKSDQRSSSMKARIESSDWQVEVRSSSEVQISMRSRACRVEDWSFGRTFPALSVVLAAGLGTSQKSPLEPLTRFHRHRCTRKYLRNRRLEVVTRVEDE